MRAQYPYQPAYGYPGPPQPPRKGRTGLIIGIVAAVAVVVLGGAAATVVIERNRLQPAAGAGPSGSAQKDTPAVSPEEYQSALDAADQELAPLYAAMVGSKHPDELQTTAFALARGIEARSTALYAIKPPTAVAAAHQHLIEALGTFGAAVSSIGGANIGAICAGASALSFVSRSTGADKLRSAIAELATADSARAYKVGAFVPPVTPDQNRTLSNGATIKPSKSSASGRFVIKNQTTFDIVASVATAGSKTALAMFYVQAGKDATYVGIPGGSYDLFLMHGQDWDSDNTTFTRQCEFHQVPKTFDFTSSSTSYSVWTVTLPEGGLDWRTLSSDFPK
jgi:hypothetical protein